MAVKLSDQWQMGFFFDAYSDDMAIETLTALGEGYTLANMVWMRHVGLENVPCCLGEAGIRYIDPPGCSKKFPCQNVLSAPEILVRGVATCIDVAAYYSARLRLTGQQAAPIFTNMTDQRGRPVSGQFHALVDTPQGVHDYTKDLIDGDNARCFADCS